MKKAIGWILLVIALLNGVSIFVRLSTGQSIGSPIYLILLVLMFIGGISLISSKKKQEDTETLPSELND